MQFAPDIMCGRYQNVALISNDETVSALFKQSQSRNYIYTSITLVSLPCLPWLNH